MLRCAGGTLYTGITNNLKERLRAHCTGRGAKYTRGRLPVELVYREQAASRGDATRREHRIKSLGRSRKLALISAAVLRALTEEAATNGAERPRGREPAPQRAGGDRR